MTARSERPIRREISWVRPPIRPLTDSRSERVLVDGGEHGVLGRDPAEAGALAPARHPLGRGRRAQHAGAAELDEHRAGGVVEPVAGDRDRAELVVCRPSARAGASVMVATLGHGTDGNSRRPSAPGVNVTRMRLEDLPAAAAGTFPVGDMTVNRIGFGTKRLAGRRARRPHGRR